MKRNILFIAIIGWSMLTAGAQTMLKSQPESSISPSKSQSADYLYNSKDDEDRILLFRENFDNGIGSFTCVNTKGSLMWHDSRTKFMKITGKVGGVKHSSESWLISPAINLSKVSNHVELSFQHGGNLDNAPTKDLTLWVSVDFKGDNFETAHWKQYTIPVYMAADSWAFVHSGGVDLDEYLGYPNVRFAFRYQSSEEACATWQIKNVKVTEILDY